MNQGLQSSDGDPSTNLSKLVHYVDPRWCSRVYTGSRDDLISKLDIHQRFLNIA